MDDTQRTGTRATHLRATCGRGATIPAPSTRPAHLWAALRYTELNPVRARLASTPEAYRWSSAAAHCRAAQPHLPLEIELWEKHWNAATWKEYLSQVGAEPDVEAIRQRTHTGRPLGTKEFIENLEKSMQRILSPGKAGRRPKPLAGKDQEFLSFD